LIQQYADDVEGRASDLGKKVDAAETTKAADEEAKDTKATEESKDSHGTNFFHSPASSSNDWLFRAWDRIKKLMS
jgi:hypothetical protein